MKYRAEDLKRWWPAKCPSCGWQGLSCQCDGGDPIADTGDFDDVVCPKCGEIVYEDKEIEVEGKGGLMNFGQALELLKAGHRVAREGWNGKNMFIYLENHIHLVFKHGAGRGTPRTYEPVIIMYTAQGKYQPGWLASQADMLAEDWAEVKE